MESKVDIKIQMENFVRQIQTSVRQASGNVTLKVTEIPEGMSDGEVMHSQELIERLTADVVSGSNFRKLGLRRYARRLRPRKQNLQKPTLPQAKPPGGGVVLPLSIPCISSSQANPSGTSLP